MKIDDIENKLREQYSDEKTIEILTQYVIDAEKTFGEYISSEEIIERLQTNIKDNFEFIDDFIYVGSTKWDGKYNSTNRKVTVSLKVKNDMNFVLFHELTHAITTRNTTDGKKIVGFDITDETGVRRGVSLNEALTDWLTVESNKEQSRNYYETSGYSIIIDQIKILSQIIGKDNLINYFFYEPENFSEFLAKYNIDFNRIDYIYKVFMQDRDNIYCLARYDKMKANISYYDDYQFCEELINIYSNAIGEVKNINDFKKKYDILCSYDKKNKDNINNIVLCYFYSMVYDDIERLISYGEDKSKIEKTLIDLNFNIKEIKQAKKWQNILSYSKNEVAIQIYKNVISSKEGSNEYTDFSEKNIGLLYDKFHEDKCIPFEPCFYDVNQYVVLGKFLNEHPMYEFDEISSFVIHLDNNVTVYRLTTANNEIFYYTVPFMIIQKIKDDTTEFYYNNSKIRISLDFNKNEMHINGAQCVSNKFYESQIKLFQYRINDETINQEQRDMYRKKYEDAMQKVKNREEVKKISAEQNV